MAIQVKDADNRWPTAISRLLFAYDSAEEQDAAYQQRGRSDQFIMGSYKISSQYAREKPTAFVLTGNESAVLLSWLKPLGVFIDLSATGNDIDRELRRAKAITERIIKVAARELDAKRFLLQSKKEAVTAAKEEAEGIMAFLDGPSARSAFARPDVRERFGKKAAELTRKIVFQSADSARRFALQTLDRLAGYPSKRLPTLSPADRAAQKSDIPTNPKLALWANQTSRGACAWVWVKRPSVDPFGNDLAVGSTALYFPYFRGGHFSRGYLVLAGYNGAMFRRAWDNAAYTGYSNILVAGYEADRYALEWFHGLTSDEAREYLWRGGYVPRGKFF